MRSPSQEMDGLLPRQHNHRLANRIEFSGEPPESHHPAESPPFEKIWGASSEDTDSLSRKSDRNSLMCPFNKTQPHNKYLGRMKYEGNDIVDAIIEYAIGTLSGSIRVDFVGTDYT
eukprot:scaffold1149_cov173-Skeletonema_marinoi.AAC.10